MSLPFVCTIHSYFGRQRREAQLAMNLVHPHIVRCLGALSAEAEGKQREEEKGSTGPGEGRGEVAFLVFEHFPGTLLELIQDRPGGLLLGEVWYGEDRILLERVCVCVTLVGCWVGEMLFAKRPDAFLGARGEVHL